MGSHDPVNILLVDDRPDKLLSYEAILKELGENLLKARSAREAFELLLKNDIAVVLADVAMPEVDGFELAAMIRQHPRFESTAIILVSAIHLTDLDRLRGFKLGAVDYVTVPVAPELLRAKVKVVTELYRKTRQLEQLNAELEQRVAERTAALAEIAERLREALRLTSVASEAGRAGVWHLNVENNRLTCSDELLALIGLDRSRFDGTLKAIEVVTHPDDIERRRHYWAKALAEDDRLEYEFRIIRPKGEVRWVHTRGNIMRRADGTASEAYGVTLDITERKEVEEGQRLRIAELDHRLNNTLALIGTIVERSVDALSAELTSRLNAVARAHVRLSAGHSTGFRELVEEELAPYRYQANAKLEGSDLAIIPEAARALGMVFHELAANAVKYGALSTADGRVSVRWQPTGESDAGHLKVVWQEMGGPPVTPPKRQGLGSRLIRDLLRHELGGRAELSMEPGGVRCEIELPLARVTPAATASAD